jgi:hypothetical protein
MMAPFRNLFENFTNIGQFALIKKVNPPIRIPEHLDEYSSIPPIQAHIVLDCDCRVDSRSGSQALNPNSPVGNTGLRLIHLSR